MGRESRKCLISVDFARAAAVVPCGTRPAAFCVGEDGGPKLACLPKGCAAGFAVDFCWVRRGGAWHSKRPATRQSEEKQLSRQEPALQKRNDEINSCGRASCVGGDFAQGDPAES